MKILKITMSIYIVTEDFKIYFGAMAPLRIAYDDYHDDFNFMVYNLSILFSRAVLVSGLLYL